MRRRAWIARQRRRAVREGASRVAVEVKYGPHAVTYRVEIWHASLAHCCDELANLNVGCARGPHAGDALQEARKTAKQKRSAIRSARHHARCRRARWRRCALVLRFILRMRRMMLARREAAGSARKRKKSDGWTLGFLL